MAEALKDWFSKEFVEDLKNKLEIVYKEFDSKGFMEFILDDKWEDLELKERMRHIAIAFNEYLPLVYKEQLEVLIAVKNKLSYDQSMALQSMVFQDFVEVYGLDDYDNSISALREFTINSSSEFAIRYFIIKYEEQTMDQMKEWAKDKNLHLRRFASEGCRPRLPWAIALPKYKKDPTKVLEILELLKCDKEKYVQKSVANNLNDIAKDNPHLVIEFVSNNLGQNKDLDWICKHASRTLLKQGDKKILELFGYGKADHVIVDNFELDSSVKLGEDLNFNFELSSKESLGNIRVEFEIEYQKANNKRSKKVFMVYQGEMKQNIKSFAKKQSFKDMTTRKHYKGLHKVAIIVNGESKVVKEFQLI